MSRSQRLPDDLERICDRARTAKAAGDWATCQEHNQQLLAGARQVGHALALTVATRFLGLCCYRLGDYERSNALFLDAGQLALEHELHRQGLLIDNHRSASLRRLGRLGEAHALLTGSIRCAEKLGIRDARVRLLGNLGALYDELGQRARADDCYARYEELVHVMGMHERRPNARGLAGRAAMLRGDYAEARWRFQDEYGLGVERGDSQIQLDGTLHLARLHLAEEGPSDALDTLLERCASLASEIQNPIRLRTLLQFRVDVALRRRNLSEVIRLVRDLERQVATPHEVMNVHRTFAHAYGSAGLHGLALVHLLKACERGIDLYAVMDNPGLRGLGQPRLDTLADLARQTFKEAHRVRRPEAEQQRASLVFRQLTGEEPEPPESVDVWTWQEHVRTEGRRVWEEDLLPGVFGELDPLSQEDLIQAELAYRGPIDDLGRVAHLLGVVVERELGRRLLPLLRDFLRENRVGRSHALRSVKARRPPSLGQSLSLAELVLGRREPADDIEVDLKRMLADHELFRTEGGLDARPLRELRDLRNAVAHGRKPPTREDVDRVKEGLVLAEPRPLCRLLRVPVQPGG